MRHITLDEFIRMLRSLGRHHGNLGRSGLYLPRAFCERLADSQKDDWRVLPWEKRGLIFFLFHLWDDFWSTLAHLERLDRETIKRLSGRVEPVTYRVRCKQGPNDTA